MSRNNSFKFVMLPPQTDITRDWAKRLAQAVPEARVIVAEDTNTAEREIVDAEAAFGWLGNDLLSTAKKLRWLQAPQAAPAAGYYYPELIAHPLVVTNFREIFNDHVSAHILAFVLAFARGLHVFIPQQLRREWKKSPDEDGDVMHLPEATALIVGLGGIGAETARLLAAFGVTVLATDARRAKAPEGVAEMHRPEALDELLPRADLVILTARTD
jgi:phosphoglycerate dehydrogenase-like enzyme